MLTTVLVKDPVCHGNPVKLRVRSFGGDLDQD